MKYTVRKVQNKWGVFAPNNQSMGGHITEHKAQLDAADLNQGIAPLLAEIERLKAELEALTLQSALQRSALENIAYWQLSGVYVGNLYKDKVKEFQLEAKRGLHCGVVSLCETYQGMPTEPCANCIMKNKESETK